MRGELELELRQAHRRLVLGNERCLVALRLT